MTTEATSRESAQGTTPAGQEPAPKVDVASQEQSQTPTPEAQPAEGSQPSAESDQSGDKKTPTPEEIAQQAKQARSRERYNRAHAESKQYQAEAIAARAEVSRLKQQLAEMRSKPTDNLPVEQQDSHRLKDVVKSERLEQAEDAAARAAQRAVEARASSFQAKVDAARDRMPDFDQVFPNTPISEAAADLIAESEKGAEIAYWLGKNPADAARIYNLPAHLQGAEIARIEGRLSTVSPRKTSNAPTPPPVLNGQSSPGAKDYNSMSMAEYAKARQAEMKAKRA